MKRYDAVDDLRKQAIAELADEEEGVSEGEVVEVFGSLEKSTVRKGNRYSTRQS